MLDCDMIFKVCPYSMGEASRAGPMLSREILGSTSLPKKEDVVTSALTCPFC